MTLSYPRALLCTALTACVFSIAPAHAQETTVDNAKLSLVKKLSGVLNISDIEQEITRSLSEQGIPDDAMNTIVSAVKDQNLQQKLLNLTADKLTVNELQAMKRFYETPEGQSVATKLPEIATESQALIEQSMQSILPQVFQALMQKTQGTQNGGAASAPAVK